MNRDSRKEGDDRRCELCSQSDKRSNESHSCAGENGIHREVEGDGVTGGAAASSGSNNAAASSGSDNAAASDDDAAASTGSSASTGTANGAAFTFDVQE